MFPGLSRGIKNIFKSYVYHLSEWMGSIFSFIKNQYIDINQKGT